MAMESMGTLNQTGAKLMQKYGSHGATDVTGFGLKGHTENLAAAQQNEVDLVIHSIPIFAGCEAKVDGMPDFKVRQGGSAETSGGILTMLPEGQARDFIKEAEQEYGQKAWMIGEVVSGTRQATIREDVDVISISEPFMLK